MLFLADRRELVKQALGAFKEHLRVAPLMDRRRRHRQRRTDPFRDLSWHDVNLPAALTRATTTSSSRMKATARLLSRYKAILDHFDAIALGLTATPTDFLDHNTFELFDCHDDSPTFYYGYDEAVRDKHLVPYRPVHVARTGFQIEGLKPGELHRTIARWRNSQPDRRDGGHGTA